MSDITRKKFRDMNQKERLQYIKTARSSLDDNNIKALEDSSILSFDDINSMIENALGGFPLPIGIATNFVINNKEYLIPMVTEEASVIAAASNAAKIAMKGGGFIASTDDPVMIGQVQLVPNSTLNTESSIQEIIKILLENRDEIIDLANTKSKSAKCIDIKVRHIDDESINNLGQMILIELLVDTKDAMGANVVNTMCEIVAPKIESLTKGQVILKILSNYAVHRLVKCRGIFPKELIGGDKVLRRILFAYALAFSDVYRAVTHNKGIMNGIDSVAIATGQDFRAIEAGCHAYASKDGKYRSLTRWHVDSKGDLVGEIEIPLAVGIVGGITRTHPVVKSCLKILDISSAKELAMIIASVGLAQNFSAIRALSDEGIQRGHMKLHSKNIAIMAGATDKEIEIISKKMVEEGNISVSRAKEILERMKEN